MELFKAGLQKPEMLVSRIPARCGICRQLGSYLQTILSCDPNYITKMESSWTFILHHLCVPGLKSYEN